MTAPIVWQTTLAALDAARATATGIRRAQAEDIATRLRSTGTSYTLRYTPEVQQQRARELADFQARQAVKLATAQVMFNAIDAEVRALDPLTDAPIQLTGPETPRTQASAVLGGVRVTATEAGALGNAIKIGLSTASAPGLLASRPPLFADVIALIQANPDIEPEQKEEYIAGFLGARAFQQAAVAALFAVTVARGNQIERFDNLSPGAVPDGSTLVTFERISVVPIASGSLTGGAGGSFSTLTGRLDRIAAQRGEAAVRSQRDRLARVPRLDGEPFSRSGRGLGWYPSTSGREELSISGLEAELSKAIGEAEGWLA